MDCIRCRSPMVFVEQVYFNCNRYYDFFVCPSCRINGCQAHVPKRKPISDSKFWLSDNMYWNQNYITVNDEV